MNRGTNIAAHLSIGPKVSGRGGLTLYGVPGWNLEWGPFVFNYIMWLMGQKCLTERTEVLVLLKQMKFEQKKRIKN